MKRILLSVLSLIVYSNTLWASYQMVNAVPPGSTTVGGRQLNEAVGNGINSAYCPATPQGAPITPQQYVTETQNLRAPGSHFNLQQQQFVPQR